MAVGGALANGPRALVRHMGPAVLTAVAAPAWAGLALGDEAIRAGGTGVARP